MPQQQYGTTSTVAATPVGYGYVAMTPSSPQAQPAPQVKQADVVKFCVWCIDHLEFSPCNAVMDRVASRVTGIIRNIDEEFSLEQSEWGNDASGRVRCNSYGIHSNTRSLKYVSDSYPLFANKS